MRSSQNRWKTSVIQWEKMKEVTREMRKNPTEAEKKLWMELRNKKLNGIKFRRQHPLGRYIVDFYSYEFNLIIEVDGSIHNLKKEEDNERQLFLENLGFKLLRFTNEEVLNIMPKVLEIILESCKIKNRTP